MVGRRNERKGRAEQTQPHFPESLNVECTPWLNYFSSVSMLLFFFVSLLFANKMCKPLSGQKTEAESWIPPLHVEFCYLSCAEFQAELTDVFLLTLPRMGILISG